MCLVCAILKCVNEIHKYTHVFMGMKQHWNILCIHMRSNMWHFHWKTYNFSRIFLIFLANSFGCKCIQFVSSFWIRYIFNHTKNYSWKYGKTSWQVLSLLMKMSCIKLHGCTVHMYIYVWTNPCNATLHLYAVPAHIFETINGSYNLLSSFDKAREELHSIL